MSQDKLFENFCLQTNTPIFEMEENKTEVSVAIYLARIYILYTKQIAHELITWSKHLSISLELMCLTFPYLTGAAEALFW